MDLKHILRRLARTPLFTAVTILAVCAGLVRAAITASYLPALRATSVDPVEEIRAE